MIDREQQKLRCAATAAKWRTAYRNRRAASQTARSRKLDYPLASLGPQKQSFFGGYALARADLERRGNFAAVSSGTDYEYFVRDLLTAAGYSVRRVGGAGDMGADLLVETVGGRVVVQCKFYSSPVGYAAVQEAYTARALYSASLAIVCSNARFTRQARRTAARLGVRLTHHAALVETLSNLAAASTATRQTATAAAPPST